MSIFFCIFQDITGWYYLLTEEIGRKKHLQVSSKQRSLQVKRKSHTCLYTTYKVTKKD